MKYSLRFANFDANWRHTLPFALLAFLLALWSGLRIALLAYAGTTQVPLTNWPEVLTKGLFFDLVVASVILGPVLVYEAFLPYSWRKARLHNWFRALWLYAFVALLLFSAVAEFTFWIEFSARLNFIALDYLIYTSEVIGNIRESYPVTRILIMIGLVATIITWAMLRWIGRSPSSKITLPQRAIVLLVAPTLSATLLLISTIDQMEGTHNAYADELSGNGLFTLTAASRRNEIDYMKFYRTLPADTITTALDELGVSRPTTIEMQRWRSTADNRALLPRFKRTPKHLVLVSVESLSASFVGSYGSAEQLTPNLDALAQDGLRFEQVYATGTRTVRGLEALSLGTPPVPGQAIVRRPGNAHLTTIGEVLEHQGFDTYFFYGGYGYFDNMNAYFGANDYRVIDRTDIPSGRVLFENVWGVADEVLFDNVISELDRRAESAKPFFAHIMTTSNHRPFTYPDGRINIPSPGGRKGAVKYSDYAIGKFIRDSKTRTWFKDTLFVFVADHCASVAGKTRLPVMHYRIPLIMYSPGNLEPGRYEHMISQIDIAPSLVDAVGRDGGKFFFGHSVFNESAAPERAFISNYQELGYLKNNKLTVLLPKRRVQAFDIDPKTLEAAPGSIDDKLLIEAIAYYQTASVDFKNNLLKAPFHR